MGLYELIIKLLRRGLLKRGVLVSSNRKDIKYFVEDNEKEVPVIKSHIDVIYAFVSSSGRATFKDIHEKLKLPFNQIEKLAKILEKHGLLMLDYPPAGSPVLSVVHEIKKNADNASPHKKRNLIIFAIFAALIISVIYYLLTMKWVLIG